jgi:putative ABC transport system permease protein
MTARPSETPVPPSEYPKTGLRPRIHPPGRVSTGMPVLVGFVLRLLLPAGELEFFLGDLEESRRRSWPRELLGAVALRLSPPPRRPRHSSAKEDRMIARVLFDLRSGLRQMLRTPGFTLAVLVTMALGIGANTAVFSILYGVALRPLPYPEADRIVFLQENNLPRGWEEFSIAPLNFWDWQARNHTFEMMAAYRKGSVNHTGGDRPESLAVYLASDGFLELLGGEPVLGRTITPADLEPEAEPVVVLSHGFWQRSCGGDPGVLGRTMILDAVPHTIVGILPADWQSLTRTGIDLVLPLQPQPSWYENRSSHFIYGLGRLKPGMTLEQARADLSTIAAALEAEYPESNNGWGARVIPLAELLLSQARSQLTLLMACVLLVLLIACANLANMTLARGTGRTRELAIRTAVGAGRGRVVGQLLVESLVLAVSGGILGVVLAYAMLAVFQAGWPNLLPRMQEVGIAPAVLAFALGVSLLSGLLFGLLPALSVAGPDLAGILRQGSRGHTGDRSRRWMRGTLVVGEVGLAVVLLVGTGLLVRSFTRLQAEDPGFRTQQRLVLATPLPRERYPSTQARIDYGERVLAGLAALPGVMQAAVTSLIPMRGSDQIWGFWLREDLAPDALEDGSALFYRVSPGYFEAMGIPRLAGRDISPEDREDTPPVVVVSAALAEQHFPGESPLGRRIRFGRSDDSPWVEIVGVVGDVQHYDLGRTSMPQLYVPFRQRPTGDLSLVIETAVAPLSLMDDVRGVIAAIDPDLPLVGFQPLEAMVSATISLPRFRTLLMSGFGLLALLLAVVGLYGIMAYSVAQRTREIGVRMALGASRGSVLGLVFGEAFPLVGAGLAVGLAGALALSRLLESMLFGVGARDPFVFVTVPLVLTLVAVAALLIPARRAVRVDPVRTLAEG